MHAGFSEETKTPKNNTGQMQRQQRCNNGSFSQFQKIQLPEKLLRAEIIIFLFPPSRVAWLLAMRKAPLAHVQMFVP
jgi:hypothetical protein